MILPTVTIYTDGACNPNPGRGGYAAVILFENGTNRIIQSGRRFTTNNRMEVMPAIAALKALRTPHKVTLYSDSEYLVNALNKRWMEFWSRKNWVRKKNKPVINADLWKVLLKLCQFHEVTFHWLKGHDGNEMNEWCDKMAEEMSRKHYKLLRIDTGYIPKF